MSQQLSHSAPDFDVDAEWNGLFVDGEWRAAADDETFEVTDPSTRDRFATVPAGTESDVNDAYQAAAAAQDDWADRPPAERREVVETVVDMLEGEHRDALHDLLVAESGSTAVKTQGELDIATEVTRLASTFPDRPSGEHAPSDVPGKENLVVREPEGVVGVISPWNYPFHLSMRAVAPAIALGNSVVLKPASSTPVTGGLAIARLFEEAGLPEGVLNVVTGFGSDIGDRVASHPEADVISFTGSTDVGQHVASLAAENLATPALELGGNNPHVVTDDADLDQALDAAVFGSFLHQGQICISINRHLVHEDVYDEYVERLADRAADLPAGSAHDEDVVVGPIVDEDQRDQILEYVDETVEAGATLETGGDHDGLVVEPTVLSDATNDMAAACNEHFGPVAPIVPFSDDEEAVELANDTEYGLSASVHSDDLGRARSLASRIESGMVHVNDQPMHTEPKHVPFGGTKSSGIGRYNDEAILRELTEEKWISVQHEPRDYPL